MQDLKLSFQLFILRCLLMVLLMSEVSGQRNDIIRPFEHAFGVVDLNVIDSTVLFRAAQIRGGVIYTVVYSETNKNVEVFEFDSTYVGYDGVIMTDNFNMLTTFSSTADQFRYEIFDSDWDLVSSRSSPIEGEWCFPDQSVVFGDSLYVITTNRTYDSEGDRDDEFQQVFVIDSTGQVINTFVHNRDEFRFSYVTDASMTSDNHLLISSDVIIRDNGVDGSQASIMKMTPGGEVVWRYTPWLPADFPTYHDELTDGNIVMAFVHDHGRIGLQGCPGRCSDTPTRLEWVSADGEPLFHNLIKVVHGSTLNLSGVVSGPDTSLLVFGAYRQRAPLSRIEQTTWAHKFGADGDSLWFKQYTHPDYPLSWDYTYNIVDIHTYDDGRSLVLADINFRDINDVGQTLVWLFEIDEDGCITPDECGEVGQIFVPTSEVEDPMDVKIYPNPAVDAVIVDLDDQQIEQVSVSDLEGRQIVTYYPQASKYNMDVSTMSAGVYLVTIVTTTGSLVTDRMVVMK